VAFISFESTLSTYKTLGIGKWLDSFSGGLLMRIMGIIVRCGCVFLLGMAAIFVTARGTDTQKKKNITAAEMRDDLRFFARELPKRHKNAFHFTPEDRFRSAINELDVHLDSMSEDAFYVGLMRIAAMVGDAHTRAWMPAESVKVLPIVVSNFADGYRLMQVAPGLEKGLGARILKIDNTPAEQFFPILSPLAAQNENPSFAPAWVNLFLRDARVLHGAGIMDSSESARFTLEDVAGQQFSLDIRSLDPGRDTPVTLVPLNKTTHFNEISEAMRKPSPTFTYTYISDGRTVYANVRGMVDVKNPAKELLTFIREKQPDKLIIDLRQNPGGNYFHGLHGLIEPIAKLPAINRKGHLFVIIGPMTGSAAIINASQFHTMTQAILVGEPIGAKPTEYSEVRTMKLPHTRIVVGYSVKFYDFAFNKENVVSPDFEIKATWGDGR
jgi:hypothetical protein